MKLLLSAFGAALCMLTSPLHAENPVKHRPPLSTPPPILDNSGAAPFISLGVLTGQYYRYSTPDGWFVKQGPVTIGGAVYAEILRKDADFGLSLVGDGGDLVLKVVGFYAFEPTMADKTQLAGAGVAVELTHGVQGSIAWAWDTTCDIRYRESHGIISNIGLDFGVLP